MLAVVLRYGMGQRQRMGLGRRPTQRPESSDAANDVGPESAEVDGVDAMMAGVKSRGVRTVLILKFWLTLTNSTG